MLNVVDLVWSKDTDSAYDGQHGGEFTHQASIIISIVPGMWVQKPQGTEKFAVLFPFRPFEGMTREPLLQCATITDELAVDSEKYNVADIQVSGLSKVGSISNERNSSLSWRRYRKSSRIPSCPKSTTWPTRRGSRRRTRSRRPTKKSR